MSKLKDHANYVTEKVDVANISIYVSTDNMISNKGGITKSQYFPTNGQVNSFKKGDVLLSNIRPYFKKVWLADRDGGCCSDILIIRPKDISSEFLYAILSQDSFFDYDMAGAKGSKMPRGDKKHIMEYPIIDIENKNKIGELLKNIEFKIKNNNKINEELESMAKTIYDYWFLQFEFPNEEGKPYKSSGGNMVWNEELKRDIPDGWNKGYLKDILSLNSNTILKKQIKETDLYTPIDCLPKKKLCFCDVAPIEKAQSSLITYKKEDILLGAMRVYFHRVCIAPFNGITRTTTFVLRPKHKGNLGFTYETINRKESIDYATKNSIGTQQPYAVWENNFENYYFAMPPVKWMLKYSERVEPLVQLIIRNCKENKELEELRDFLLPLLMNGQVGFRELALAED